MKRMTSHLPFRKFHVCFMVLLLMVSVCRKSVAQPFGHIKLRERIKKLEQTSSGKLGVAIRLLESGDTVTYHDNQRYPMQSVFKFPIAFLTLRAVDKGRLRLDDSIFVSKDDLHKTVSALFQKYPTGNVKVTVREILTDMVTVSDNNACDILMRLLGGPEKLTLELRKIGINDMVIQGNEFEMSFYWPLQYQNWSRPSAQIRLLKKLFDRSLLSVTNNYLLMDLMLKTYVAPNRIRGLLPAHTPVAHRSGTSGTNAHGLSPATNDVGIITLPNGKHLAIAVFLTDSYDDDQKRDRLIAMVAKAAYDEFSVK